MANPSPWKLSIIHAFHSLTEHLPGDSQVVQIVRPAYRVTVGPWETERGEVPPQQDLGPAPATNYWGPFAIPYQRLKEGSDESSSPGWAGVGGQGSIAPRRGGVNKQACVDCLVMEFYVWNITKQHFHHLNHRRESLTNTLR